MGDSAARRGRAVDHDTGEIVEMTLFESDAVERTRVRYDWNPYPGRHVTLGKKSVAAMYNDDSGYNSHVRDLLLFFLVHAPDGAEPLRMSTKEIAEEIGARPNAVAARLRTLREGGFLLEAETAGRTIYYRVNPRVAYDGPATHQIEAVGTARHPVVPAPAPAPVPDRRRTLKAVPADGTPAPRKRTRKDTPQ